MYAEMSDIYECPGLFKAGNEELRIASPEYTEWMHLALDITTLLPGKERTQLNLPRLETAASVSPFYKSGREQ